MQSLVGFVLICKTQGIAHSVKLDRVSIKLDRAVFYGSDLMPRFSNFAETQVLEMHVAKKRF